MFVKFANLKPGNRFITRHELAVAPNCKVPALLIALASDKENGKEYYEYARAQYRKINYVVSHANDTKFEAMKLKDLKLIRNLTLVFTREQSVLSKTSSLENY